MKRFVVTLAALAPLACSDVTVPNGLFLTCTSSEECPDELVCEPESKLCVPPRVGDDLTIADASVSVARVGLPFVDEGAPIEVTITFNTAPLRAPRVRLVGDVAELAVVDAVATDEPLTFVASYTPTGEEPDGVVRAIVEALDASGIPRALPTNVAIVFDYSPPRAVSVTVQRVPDPRLTPVALEIADFDEVGPAQVVRIVFATDEPVFVDGEAGDVAARPENTVTLDDPRAPRVVTDALVPLSFTRDRAVNSPLIFELEWPAVTGGLDGPHGVVARITDLAGNTREELLLVEDPESAEGGLIDLSLTVDTTPPAPPAVDQPGAVVFERAEWGRAERAEGEVFTVVGAPSSVETGTAFVLVSRDAEGLAELGRRRVSADDGSFGGVADLLLPTGDLDTVYVRAIDRAGNGSSIVEVKDVRWFATMLNKAAGSDLDNPHELAELPLFARQLGQGGVVERGADTGVGEPGGGALTTTTGGTWTLVPLDDGVEPFQPVGSALAHDPVRNLDILFGGVVTGPNTGPAGFVQRGACAQQHDRVFLRGRDGRWRERIPGPLEQVPETSSPVGIAWVPPLDAFVLVMFGGETWTFDGERFEQLCGIYGCADPKEFAGAPAGGAVWDPARNVLVTRTFGSVMEWDGNVWTRRDVGAPGGPIVYDENLRAVVAYDGAALHAYDGEQWTPLCADAACAATAPPPRAGANIAFDRLRRELVMFGGEGENPCGYGAAANIVASQGLAPQPDAPLNDTWIFDGSTWRQASPTTSPPGRDGHTMAWNEARQAVVMVGGDDCNCLGDTLSITTPFDTAMRGDTWEWNGSTWRQVAANPPAPPGFFRANPPVIRDHRMITSPSHGGVLAVNGTVPTSNNLRLLIEDTWFLSTATIGGPNPHLPAVAATPSGSIFAFGGAVNDSGVLVPQGPPFHFVLTGTTIDLACPENPTIPECQFPGTLPFGAAAFHDGTRVWAYGGGRNAVQFFADTGPRFLHEVGTSDLWSWAPVEGWVLHCATGECGEVPPARIDHAGVLDEQGRFVVFGGLGADGSVLGDTWIFDGTTWTQGPSGPPARHAHVLAHDLARGTTVLALGTDVRGPGFAPPNSVSPPARDIPESMEEVWELADGAWQQVAHVDVEGDGRPGGRHGVAGAGRLEGGIVVYGGTFEPEQLMNDVADAVVTAARTADTWVWNGGASERPAHRMRVSTAAARLRPLDEVTAIEVRWLGVGGDSANGATSTALDLLLWDGAGWRAALDSERVECGAGCAGAAFPAFEAKRALAQPGGRIIVAAVPREPTGSGAGRATITTDFVEVTLVYRRP